MAQIFAPSANNLAKLSLILGAGAPFALFYVGSTISRSPMNTNVGVAPNQPAFFSHKHHAYELGIDCRYCHTSVEKGAVAGVPPTETCMSCHSQIWTNSELLKPVRDSFATGKPLVWNKVSKVPEFVYFNHSIHIARGINCNECHGGITDMQMTAKAKQFSMSWCLECHREPEKFLVAGGDDPNASPQEQAFQLYRRAQRAEKLSIKEYNLFWGKDHTPTDEQVSEGRKLLEKYKVTKEQLMDCWVCHR
jgi:hypothetical protein